MPPAAGDHDGCRERHAAVGVEDRGGDDHGGRNQRDLEHDPMIGATSSPALLRRRLAASLLAA